MHARNIDSQPFLIKEVNLTNGSSFKEGEVRSKESHIKVTAGRFNGTGSVDPFFAWNREKDARDATTSHDEEEEKEIAITLARFGSGSVERFIQKRTNLAKSMIEGALVTDSQAREGISGDQINKEVDEADSGVQGKGKEISNVEENEDGELLKEGVLKAISEQEHQCEEVVNTGVGDHTGMNHETRQEASRSWSAIVGKARVIGTKTLKFIQPTIVEGRKVVHFDSKTYIPKFKDYSELVIGKFVGDV